MTYGFKIISLQNGTKKETLQVQFPSDLDPYRPKPLLQTYLVHRPIVVLRILATHKKFEIIVKLNGLQIS